MTVQQENLLSSVGAGLRRYLTNRRQVPRFQARPEPPLVVSASLLDRDTAPSAADLSSIVLIGRARDLSAHGLSLVLPSLADDRRGIVADGNLLLIVLALPNGSISMQAAVAYSRHMIESEAGDVIGLRITEISSHNRAQLSEYLSTLDLLCG